MKRLLVFVLVAGLVGGLSVTADAGKKKKRIRKVTISYAHPAVGVAPGGGYPCRFPEGDCSVATTPKDKYFKITVKDASGEKVWGFVSQGDLNGNGVNDDGYATFCGKHTSPQAVAAPGKEMNIYLASGVCDDGSTSLMTTGQVIVQLSSRPF